MVKRNALFCVICRLLICLLLRACVGIEGQSSIGRMSVLTKCDLILVSMSFESVESFYYSLGFVYSFCCVFSVAIFASG